MWCFFMTKVTNIAVFASGSGTNFEVIAKQAKEGHIACEIALLICDQPDAKVIEKAKKYNIPVFAFRAKGYPSKTVFEEEILDELTRLKVDWIFLAGYMRLIGKTLLEAYQGKIINIHPSLLPAFPGKDAVGQALQAKASTTGVTVHYVDEGMDTGPIIAQEKVAISTMDTEQTLHKKIQQVEHRLYPQVIRRLLREDLH